MIRKFWFFSVHCSHQNNLARRLQTTAGESDIDWGIIKFGIITSYRITYTPKNHKLQVEMREMRGTSEALTYVRTVGNMNYYSPSPKYVLK